MNRGSAIINFENAIMKHEESASWRHTLTYTSIIVCISYFAAISSSRPAHHDSCLISQRTHINRSLSVRQLLVPLSQSLNQFLASLTLAAVPQVSNKYKNLFQTENNNTHGEVEAEFSVKFTEARRHLERRQSSRASGIFGFNLSHTLTTERNTIPILVRKCVAEIEARGLQLEGIYRISGNARKKKVILLGQK